MIILLLGIISVFFLFLSSIFLLFVILKYLRTVKIPDFWMYFVGAFYLLSLYGFLLVLAPFISPYDIIAEAVKLIANIFMFLAIYEIYKRIKK